LRDTYQIQNISFSCFPHRNNFLYCCLQLETHRSLYRSFLLSREIPIERTKEYSDKRPWRQEALIWWEKPINAGYLSEGYEDGGTVLEGGSNPCPHINVQSDSPSIEKDNNSGTPPKEPAGTFCPLSSTSFSYQITKRRMIAGISPALDKAGG